MDNITFSEIMEFYPKHNRSVYEELKDACQRGCIIPFVGAGLSVFCGYLGWPDVLKELAEYIYDRNIQTGIRKMIDAGELLQAAQSIQDHYPRMLKALQKIIDYDKIKNCDSDKLYAAAAYVLPYLFNNSFVMTTNFDRVLEETYDRCHAKFGKVITPYEPDLLVQSRQNNSHCLFKLHGDIGPEIHDIKHLIFTQTQYDEAYTSNGPLMQELSQWFQNKRLLFLGCSLEKDRTMEVLQQVTSKNPGLNHYAILECRPDDISKRCIEMEDLGISAIYYPDKKYESVRIILERLLEDTNHTSYEELNRYSQKSVSVPQSAHRFMYDSDYVKFVGRGDELTQLQEFCKNPGQVSWWAVTGPGGIGKSRLIYEFTNAQKADGWKICWLKYSDYDNLLHWAPPIDRCIIVADDVQAHLQAIGNWIVSVSSRPRSEKLRIILLERDGKDLNSAKWAELLQSDFPYDNTIISRCYCSDFLNLAPLTDDELKAIITDFAKASAKPLMNNGHAEQLLQTLKRIDGKLQRPIYALAITDAWCNGEDPTCWDKEKVLDTLLRHELRFYYERLRSISADKISKETRFELENLLARSCTIPFLSLTKIADDDCQKLRKIADKLEISFPELLRQIGIVHKIKVHINDAELENYAIQMGTVEAVVLDCPDLVKEYFVLQQAFNKGQINLLFPEGWDNSPMQLFFLCRILLDYPEKLAEEKQFWMTLFAGGPKSEFPAQLYGNLLFSAIVRFPKMERHALGMLEKLHNHFHTNERLAVKYAMGLVNLTTEQTLAERMQSVGRLRLLYEQFPISEELAAEYAMGLVNLTAEQTLDERIQSVGRLRLLYEQFPKSEELVTAYASGLFNLSIKQTLKECVHSVDRLRQFYEQFPKSEELATAYAKGLVNLSIKQTLEECAHSVDRLRLLYEQFPISKELAANYAKGLVNLTAEQTLKERTQNIDRLRFLYEQFSISEELATEYAKGLVNLSAEQILEERTQSIDILRFLYEQFPISKGLVANYAKGLYNLSIKQTLVERAQSVDRLRLLYEQFPINEELAVIYAMGLFNLSMKQTLEECAHSVDRLRRLYKQFPKSEELATAYAKGLVNLSVEQTLKECAHSVDRLKLLYEQFPKSEELATAYAKGLVNLSVEQTLKECAHSVDRLRRLYEQFPASEGVAVMYANGLYNLSAEQALEECVQSVNRLKLLYEQFPASEELADIYADGLVILSYNQSEEMDIQKSIKQAKKLFTKYYQNTEIQLSYAQTLFNLTLKQAPEALLQTVAQLREFLLEYPDANQKFQIFLDTYLGEHPEHIERYNALKV